MKDLLLMIVISKKNSCFYLRKFNAHWNRVKTRLIVLVRHYVTLNYLFLCTLKAKYYMKNLYIFNVARALYDL